MVDEVAELTVGELGDDRAAGPPKKRPQGGPVRSPGSIDRWTFTSSAAPKHRMPKRCRGS